MTSAAIDTLTLCWSAIRDELRRRLRGPELHLAPWWEEARLLCVMGFSHGFGWNIQQTYNQRRRSNLLLSPLDWLLLDHYALYDIPRLAITRGIHKMFDRRNSARQFNFREINSLAYCDQAILKEAELIREANVGCHGDFSGHEYEDRKKPHTLLLAVPPAGRMTFAAMQSERQVDRVAEMFQVGIVFTVYPDAWHKSEARARFGVELEFLDTDVDPVHLSSGSSRLAGSRRSRQPFLNQQNLHHGDTETRSGRKLQESSALDISASAADDRGSHATAAHGKTQPLSDRPLHPPIAAGLPAPEVHAELTHKPMEAHG